MEMYVTKRNNELEEFSFDKIVRRLKLLNSSTNSSTNSINYSQLAMKVIEQLYNNITTTKIDELAAEQCASMVTIHPDYGKLAAKIVISNHHKNVHYSFSEITHLLYTQLDINGNPSPQVSLDYYQFVMKHATQLNEMIQTERDFLIDYFGFKTLERAYLKRTSDGITERLQHLWLRVAVGIHGTTDKTDKTDKTNESTLSLIQETYDLMSMKYFTHATPTLFNAGSPNPQMSSCYLLGMEEDSIEGIYNTLKDCALISKYSGGIGLHIHNVRSAGSLIRGTNGQSNGIVPMLRVFNNTAKYVDQGGGKRNGSIAIYLEPWHPDIFDFLEMRKNHGDEDRRARDLFYGLWIPDLFMERVKEENGQWSLFCPFECPGLANVYGEEFKELYESYELSKKAKRTVNARELWLAILDSQMETGTPYMCYKDAVNSKSNQQNVGTIQSSNLCTEIMQYSDATETAVCNLASIGLPSFVQEGVFQFDKLHKVVKIVVNNLDNIIDLNFYPTEKTRVSNLRHRPMGIGVQGLADVYFLLNIAYHSVEARTLNVQIFETIYHASLEKSHELALQKGSYSSFEGSPASKGILQFDMWNVVPSERYDWTTLKKNIQQGGLRNSLLVAPMPTASTSQILGFNECFEPITSNIYSRRTLAGEFVVVNKYLMEELIALGQWNEQIKNNIIANKGSIQQLTFLSQSLRDKYKIVWEIPMKHLIDMSVERGAFICQSQSLNLWMEEPVYNKLSSMHFYAWEKGLKTGIYYLRRKATHQAQQFTIEPTNDTNDNNNNNKHEKKEDEPCEMCSA